MSLGLDVDNSRTDMYCHNCNKNFIAQIDVRLSGNHEIQCPHCSHIHYRVVRKGSVTEDRFDSDNSTKEVHKAKVWKHDSQNISTTTTSAFIRERWLQTIV